jgi:hypothetical protein
MYMLELTDLYLRQFHFGANLFSFATYEKRLGVFILRNNPEYIRPRPPFPNLLDLSSRRLIQDRIGRPGSSAQVRAPSDPYHLDVSINLVCLYASQLILSFMFWVHRDHSPC